jgi:hypothetical protein
MDKKEACEEATEVLVTKSPQAYDNPIKQCDSCFFMVSSSFPGYNIGSPQVVSGQ